jgi:hypothetical protein
MKETIGDVKIRYMELYDKHRELEQQLKEAETRCNTKDATIEYLEQFIVFCEACKNPSNDCLC